MAKFHWRDFLQKTAAIAIPVALQNLLMTTGSMIDTMMIASLGQLSVAAVGLCAQFSSLMFSGYWGFVGGGMLFFSQYYGARDDEGIHRSFGLTLLCMLVVGLSFGLFGTLFPAQVMDLYTDKAAIAAIGEKYLRIVALSYPLNVIAMAASSLLRSTGRVRIPLYAGITQVVVNCFLNYCLIGGHLGFPALGVEGAAVATLISSVVNVTVVYLLAWRSGHGYLTAFSRHFRFSGHGSFVRQYFMKCFPIICNELLIGIGNMVINVVLGRQSENAIAAIAVFRTLEGLVIGFFAGFSNAASVLVGKEVGAGHPETAYQRAIRMVYLCMGCIGCVGLALIALHTPILTAMGLSGESLQIGYGLLLIYTVASVIRMGNWTHNDTFRSAGDATWGTVLEILFMYGMVLPLVTSIGLLLHAPFFLVFACCYMDEPVRFIFMQVHLWHGTWIRPVTEEGRAAMPAFRVDHPQSARRWRREKEA
ncbi:MAG: MATE family efflux transporter [Clostridia bacterium]|nr:MATE family efflux transporter [Clostridia bacterium]